MHQLYRKRRPRTIPSSWGGAIRLEYFGAPGEQRGARAAGPHLAEAIDDLYRHDAAAQFERAFSLGQLCEGQRNEEGH